jgi:hypothetical protein
MALIRMVCPRCRQVLAENECLPCGVHLRDYQPMYHAVLASYGRAQAFVSKDKLQEAIEDLRGALPVFPFVEEILHFYFRLAVEVGSFHEAQKALAWLNPFQNEKERDEAFEFLESAVCRFNAIVKGDTNESGGEPELAILGHVVALAGARLRESANATGGKQGINLNVRHHRMLVLAAALVLSLGVATVTMGIRSARSEQGWKAEVDSARKNLSSIETRTVAKLDSLRAVIQSRNENLATTKAKQVHLEKTVNEHQVMTEILSEKGPHNLYWMLGLNKPEAPDRISKMAMFVRIFPDEICYTGPFLRELFDHHRLRDKQMARNYALTLSDYCSNHTQLSYLVSNQVKLSIDGAEHHD